MKGTEPHKLGDMDTAKKTKKKHEKNEKEINGEKVKVFTKPDVIRTL